MATSTPISTTNKSLPRRGVCLAIGLLLTGLIVTALAVRCTKSGVDAAAKREFDFVCIEIQTKILDRLHAHEQILRSAAAFYEHSDGITRVEWCRFARLQKIEQRLPGIQGIGFALLIPRQQMAQHVQKIRAEGFPEYHIWPEGQRETYSSIIYLEPFSGRNLRAFGYDMLAEPVRREALERARDENTAVLSGKVVLVQETEKEIQAGALMYMPVYRNEMPSETVAQRRAAILGWVYSPYRMNDLMQDVLGGSDFEGSKRIHLEAFDGEKVSPETLLYDSQSVEGNEQPPASALALQIPVDLAGRRWTLRFTPSSLAAAVDYSKVWLVLFAGTSVSLLLFGLSLTLLNTQFKAWQIATKLTAEYKRVVEELHVSKQFLQEAQRIAHLAGWKVNPHTDYLEWTDGVYEIIEAPKGRQPGLAEGLKYFLPEYIPTLRDSIVRCLATGERFALECQVFTGTGKTIWTEVRGIAPMVNGERAYVLGTFQNITKRKRMEEQLRSKTALLEAQVDSSLDGILVIDGQNKRLLSNQRLCDLWNPPQHILDDPDDTALLKYVMSLTKDPEQILKKVMHLNDHPAETSRDEVEFKDGMVLDRYSSPILGTEGQYYGRIWTFRDITERKEMERRQCLSAEILGILNDPHALSDAIKRILAAIQRTMGFDAVGIRLQNGDDFPYYSQSGFSSDFLQTENTLMVRGRDGGPCRDNNGNISLECTCGLVLSGQTDPASPLFTTGGSFWTNNSLPLLELSADQDPRLHPRNRCIHEGFCSVALIPIRTNQEIVGLLQFNDRKKDCFTLETVRFFEEISSSIGMALMRKQAETALRESETRMRAITDSAQDAILMIDTDGRVSYWNPAAERIFGYTNAEAIGQNLHQFLVPQRYHVAHHAAFPEFRRTGQGSAMGKTLDLEARRKDGKEISVQLSLSAIQIHGDWHAVGILRDITEQKRAKEQIGQYAADLESSNQALKESNQIAESATRAKSEFLANMSHEIRTPMTAILGYADILLEESVGQASCEHVKVIKRNGEHLLGLINDILDLSKVEAGKMQIEPICCSPFDLLAEVASLMRVRATAKQLRLEMEQVGPLPETILTDPLRLRQVLINLVGNAIKFTDQGEVRIAVRLIGGAAVSAASVGWAERSESHQNRAEYCGAAVSAAMAGETPAPQAVPGLQLRFDVTDTGIGMNEEQIGKLFQAFSQVDNSSTRKFGGTGLGLCISQRLAEAMGGKIEVHSTLGKGSTFSVTIDPGPLDGIRMIQNLQEALLEHPPTPSAATPDEIKLSGRILLAEDGPDNQRLIAFVLRKAGAEVTLAENGQLAHDEALAALAQGTPFDVILMDMQMPVMDGYETTRSLRNEGYHGPIVALTAHAMAEDRQKCLDAGCDDFATKPIDRQMLLSAAAHWMDRGRTNELPSTCPTLTPCFCGAAVPAASVGWAERSESHQNRAEYCGAAVSAARAGETPAPQAARAGETPAPQAACAGETPAPQVVFGRAPKPTAVPAASESNTSSARHSPLIYSQLAADPDLSDLVELFVQGMPDRINALKTHARSRDWQQLTRTAHQIKGAVGSYGFGEVTPYAARLEAAARNGSQEEDILSALDELLSLCRQVRSGVPQAEDEHCPSQRSETP